MRFLPTAVILALLLAPFLAAQNGLRLTRVPDQVVLPARAGTNLLLEVAVIGEPELIWLARTRDQIARVPLSPAGGGRYQLNLAEPEVLRLLHAELASGTFRIFARFGADVVASAEIGWRRGETPATRPQCFVLARDGSKKKASKEQVRWLDPAAVERFEVHGISAPVARVIARAGHTDCPMTWRPDDRLFVLELNDGLRRSLLAAGEFALEVRAGTETTLFDWRVVPDRIDFPDEALTLTVMQRRHARIPGSRDWLEVRLGDITMGQVMLSMHDAEDGVVVEPRLVAEHDPVEFALAGESYVLSIDKLRNRLIGDDWAELSLVPKPAFKPDPIAALIRRVRDSEGVTFVRDGKDYDGKMAAQLLRARLGSHRGARPTPPQFVAMGGKSSTTGKPYHVRLANGEQQDAAAWLGELLRAIEAENAAAAAKSRGQK